MNAVVEVDESDVDPGTDSGADDGAPSSVVLVRTPAGAVVDEDDGPPPLVLEHASVEYAKATTIIAVHTFALSTTAAVPRRRHFANALR